MACSQELNSKVFGYEILNGNTAEMNIVDPLLDTEDRARERAMSEFLKNAYTTISISITTHVTTFKINDIINIAGVPYLIKNISTSADKVKTIVTIGAKRYE